MAAHKTPVRAARRARIILLAADGVPSRQISAIVAMHESNVAKWRNRFREKGLEGLEGLEGLADDPRSGRRRRLGHDERMQAVTGMCAVLVGVTDTDNASLERCSKWAIFGDTHGRPRCALHVPADRPSTARSSRPNAQGDLPGNPSVIAGCREPHRSGFVPIHTPSVFVEVRIHRDEE